MGKFQEAVQAKNPAAIAAAMDAAIAANDVEDVRAACSACCEGTYDETTLTQLNEKLGGAGDRINIPINNEATANIVSAARESLAEYFVIEKNDVARATLLLQPLITPKAGQGIPDDVVIRATVKMIELLCFASEFYQAETLMGKCAKYLRYQTSDTTLKVRFNCTQAQVHEQKRRFTEAAQRFYDVSVNDATQAAEALQRAAVCAILAEPSDARGRIVGVIVNDDRSAKSLKALYPIVVKVHQMRFLRVQDAAVIKTFVINESQTAGSPSLLDTALLTHNIKAVSQVYYNISLSELASLVGAKGGSDEVLKVVAAMISANKINGTIDQVSDLVTFHSSRDDACVRSDAQIAFVCNTISQVYESIKVAHPQLAV